MKPWLVELWKSRVQYLRPYYACTKPQQTDYPINSRHVWSLPLMWTCWSTLILAILLLALTVQDIMDIGSALANLNLALYLNTPLMVFWWRFAVLMAEEDAKSRYYKSKLRFCPSSHSLPRNGCVMTHPFKSGVPVTMAVQPLKRKCRRRRRVKFIVHGRDSKRMISLLLMLAGDVETNPGPGIDRYLELIPIHNHWKLDEELDWDNDYDRDLTEIAKGLTNWQTNLRVPLGLTLADVRRINQTKYPALKQIEVLHIWKQERAFDATYRNLLNCVAGKDHKTATRICNLAIFSEPSQPPHPPQQPISNLTLRDICNALATVKYKWFSFGIQLGIPPHKLKEFEKEADPLEKTVDYFLKGNVEGVPLSWNSIVTALKSDLVGEPALAKNMFAAERQLLQQDTWKVPPKYVLEDDHVEAQAGESPTLHFSVTSYPPLTENTRHVVATENGDIVRRFKVQDNCITFRNVKIADTGLYTISCLGANGKATFELNISESSADNEEKPEKLLSEALKKGVVISKHVVIILVGIAKSGKSSFKRVLLELEPKDVYDSTGLAEDPLRSISFTRCITDDPNSIKWEFVSAEQLLSMLANAIREVGSSQESSNTAIKEVGLSQESSSTAIKEVGLSQEFSAQGTDDIIIDESDPLLPLISQSKGSRRLLDVHWVYVIDTGGQPQFLHLLPAFIKNISSCVCLVRLDQSLDEKPMIEFCESGKQCGKSYRSEYTNLQVVQSCVRTIHSRSCLHSENPPNCFVVGSHLDKYEKMEEPPESIEDKNKTLLTKFKSAKLGKSLIYYKLGDPIQQDQGVAAESGEMCARHDKLIYPLNCEDPKDEDKKIAGEFRKDVMRHCSEREAKIPLAWFVLEERIRQYATKNKVDYIDKATCIEDIAKPLNIDSIEFESALDHLLKLNIFRCYSSLPDLIFCGNQVVLMKLTEIVKYNYHLREEHGLSYEERRFINEGILNVKFLSQSRFSNFYSKNFTPQSFLDILLEVHAVAKIQLAEEQEQNFLMPALLDELSEQEIAKKRAQCSCPSLSPLLLVPESECLPNGLFTTLVAHLQNKHGWKLDNLCRPYQNCVSFCIPGDLPGDITLIASFKYLEVHVKCLIEGETDRVCDQAFFDLKSSLQASWKILYPCEVQYYHAFFCGSDGCPNSLYKHHALVICKQEYEKCSVNTTCFSSLCESKRRWLTITNAACIKEQRVTTITGPIEPVNDGPQLSTATTTGPQTRPKPTPRRRPTSALSTLPPQLSPPATGPLTRQTPPAVYPKPTSRLQPTSPPQQPLDTSHLARVTPPAVCPKPTSRLQPTSSPQPSLAHVTNPLTRVTTPAVYPKPKSRIQPPSPPYPSSPMSPPQPSLPQDTSPLASLTPPAVYPKPTSHLQSTSPSQLTPPSSSSSPLASLTPPPVYPKPTSHLQPTSFLQSTSPSQLTPPSSYSTLPLELCYLQLIKWTSPQGDKRTFRLTERVSTKWRKFGGRISLHPNVMDGWRQCGETAESCWEKTMQLWLDGQGNKQYPKSWESLYEMLEDVQLGGVVPDLREAVNGASAQR